MFNYYLKSRDRNEINKRVDYLVKVFEKEVKIIVIFNSFLILLMLRAKVTQTQNFQIAI